MAKKGERRANILFFRLKGTADSVGFCGIVRMIATPAVAPSLAVYSR